MDTSLCLSAITDSPDLSLFAISFGKIFNNNLSDLSFSFLISSKILFPYPLDAFFYTS